jgi:hypothetical protein
MTTFIFVHGTGVREPAYTKTFETVQRKLSIFAPNAKLVPCYWGKSCGAELRQGGDSIPTYGLTRAIGGTPPVEDAVALWTLLYQDPLFELRLLADRGESDGELAPRDTREPEAFKTAFDALEQGAGFADALRELQLQPFWRDAVASVRDADELMEAVQAQGEPGTRPALARAIVATTLRAAGEAGIPPPGAAQRDALVVAVINAQGGSERAISDWFKKKLSGIAADLGTRYAGPRRGQLTDITNAGIGDILLYQTRGEPIRKFIGDKITAIKDDVVVLAHSLGGIACIDLLIEVPLPAVKALVTAGSQAPYFYEIGALCRLPFDSKVAHADRLPAHFPATWYNFWDPNDLLGYWAERMFPKRVTDFRVPSGQPFPQSHSAYWTNDDLWRPVGKLA